MKVWILFKDVTGGYGSRIIGVYDNGDQPKRVISKLSSGEKPLHRIQEHQVISRTRPAEGDNL